MTDEQVEKIIKSNMMLQMNLAGIRADFEEALQRTWVGLSDEEVGILHRISINTDEKGWGFLNHKRFAGNIEAKIKEKNS